MFRITLRVKEDADFTDYTISGDRFVFGGENPVDSIVVTTLKLGTGRTLSLSVDVPEGYAAGKYLTSEYTLQDKLAFFSFSKNLNHCLSELYLSSTVDAVKSGGNNSARISCTFSAWIETCDLRMLQGLGIARDTYRR